jgi:hypothetical protein
MHNPQTKQAARKLAEANSDSLGIWTASQPSHACINDADAHLQRCQDVGQRLAIPVTAHNTHQKYENTAWSRTSGRCEEGFMAVASQLT